MRRRLRRKPRTEQFDHTTQSRTREPGWVQDRDGTEQRFAGCRVPTGRHDDRQIPIGAALAAALAASASAQPATEYYVVQDATTKKCTIVEKKPTTTTVVQVGPMVFKSRTEAEAGMKTITVCSSN